MAASEKLSNILSQIDEVSTKLGDLRKIAGEIKKDHGLALELWATGGYLARQLAILIMDKKLLSSIEANIEKEEPDVQWAMNFTAAQIGIFQPEYRSRCIALSENTGLYRDEIVAKNCTANYLPKYIATQVAKIKK